MLGIIIIIIILKYILHNKNTFVQLFLFTADNHVTAREQRVSGCAVSNNSLLLHCE